MASKKVLIRVVSKNLGYVPGMPDEVSRYLEEPNDFKGVEIAAELDLKLGFAGEDDGDMPSMLETEAELSEENGCISLSYTTVLQGPFESYSKYTFNTEERDYLTLLRRNIYEEVYFFDGKTRRQNVIFEDESSQLEFSLYTKKLRNQLLYELGGFLEIEYYVEIKGGLAEHYREYIFVEPGV